MKITTRTSKDEMVKYLGESAALVKEADKSLYDRLAYASKMYKKDPDKVTRKDLVDLVRDTVQCLVDVDEEDEDEVPFTSAPVMAEASLRKTSLKKGARKTSPETTEPELEEEDEEEVAPTKEEETKPAKTVGKKKPSGKKQVDPEDSHASDLADASVFKDSFEMDEETYEIAHDIKTMDDLYSALSREEEIVFAMYWTKRLIKQFVYFQGLVKAPKEFPMDLDLATCIYASDNGNVAYMVSIYTEACYMLLPENLEEIDGIRYSGGIEYQIYRKTTSEEE